LTDFSETVHESKTCVEDVVNNYELKESRQKVLKKQLSRDQLSRDHLIHEELTQLALLRSKTDKEYLKKGAKLRHYH